MLDMGEKVIIDPIYQIVEITAQKVALRTAFGLSTYEREDVEEQLSSYYKKQYNPVPIVLAENGNALNFPNLQRLAAELYDDAATYVQLEKGRTIFETPRGVNVVTGPIDRRAKLALLEDTAVVGFGIKKDELEFLKTRYETMSEDQRIDLINAHLRFANAKIAKELI